MTAVVDDARLAPSLADLMRLEHEARGYSFQQRQPVRSLLSGRRASRIRGRGLAFEELRGYQPGDDVRQIDWRASARTGRTQTRVFTEERDRPTLLVVDMGAAMFFGSVHATKSAVAAQVAALVAWRSLRAGDRLGALLFGGNGVEEFRPHRSRTAVTRVLAAVAGRCAALRTAAPGPAGPDALAAALHRAEMLASHDWLVVIIADVGAADPAVAPVLGRIARHNTVIAVPVSDPLERTLPAPPWRAAATDGTRTAVLEPGRGGLGQRVASGFGERMQAIRRGGIRLETPVLPLGTEGEAAPQLRRLIGAAGPRRRP